MINDGSHDDDNVVPLKSGADSGRSNDLWELTEEDDDDFIEAWDSAERECVQLFRSALETHRGRPPPPELALAATGLRAGFESGTWPYDWVRRAAGLTGKLPSDDTELIVDAVTSTISPREATGLAPEEESLIITLEHADWLGAVLGLVRGGPGAKATPRALVEAIEACPEIEGNVDLDDTYLVEAAFEVVLPAWQAAGLIDDRRRLTPVGGWVLPRALARAWSGDFDAEPD